MDCYHSLSSGRLLKVIMLFDTELGAGMYASTCFLTMCAFPTHQDLMFWYWISDLSQQAVHVVSILPNCMAEDIPTASLSFWTRDRFEL